mmetsp:Transcript_2691/g.5883  ORF Transcript_2691/g.5883 Transcript_2691/m.5883 type:complete len:126 (+) Transcript_2691:1028-1405(+)
MKLNPLFEPFVAKWAKQPTIQIHQYLRKEANACSSKNNNKKNWHHARDTLIWTHATEVATGEGENAIGVRITCSYRRLAVSLTIHKYISSRLAIIGFVSMRRNPRRVILKPVKDFNDDVLGRSLI